MMAFQRPKGKAANNRMHSDSKKRRSFLALLFAAGDARRWAASSPKHMDLWVQGGGDSNEKANHETKTVAGMCA